MAISGEATAPRVDRRKVRSRRYLLEAAINLLLEQGYEEMTTDAIADRADVGRRTFYNHFVNKRDCLIDAVAERFLQYAQEESEGIEMANEQRDEAVVIATMAHRVFLDIAGDPVAERLTHFPKVLSESIAKSQRDYLLDNLVRGLESKRLRPVLSVEALEPILAWGFVGLVVASIGRETQVQDSVAWAQFVLHNLGLEEREIPEILAKLTR